jgi:hypothetical protein
MGVGATTARSPDSRGGSTGPAAVIWGTGSEEKAGGVWTGTEPGIDPATVAVVAVC